VALLTCIYPTQGTVCTPVAVNSTDTISGNDINAGAMLIVNCGGTTTNVTITDPGHTAAGNTGTQGAQNVAINTSRSWGPSVLKNFIDPSTNLVTVNYSSVTAVTAMVMADGD
jgi:hypothetical protein